MQCSRAHGRLRAGLVILAALCGGVAACAGDAPESGASAPPASLLLITLDTTRADHLGCYGAAFASTPSLDALCAAGVRFDSALSPTPLTLPSHATIMTGRVPRTHGIRDNALFRLDAEVPVLAEALRDAGYRTAAFVSSAVLDRRTGIDRGFERYDDSVRIGDRSAFNYEERAASQTVDALIGRLPGLAPPFFLWVHLFDPHLPYVPPEPFRGRFPKRPYDGEIAFMDHEVGRLLDAVRSRAGALLIAVAGDHGESLGEHGEEAHGIFVYQSTQRVPLILAGPSVPAGRTIASNVGLVDLAPTILDLLRLPPLDGADGRSLAALWRPGAPAAAAPDYEMETFFPRFSFGWSPLRALVRGSLKLIEAPEPELYDLAADPGERRNLHAERPRRARDVRTALHARIGDDDPGMPEIDPELAEQRRRLEALGYLGGTAASAGPAIDPKRAIGWVRDLDAARRELQTGSPANAREMLDALLAKSPRTLPALLTLAQSHLRLGDAAQAVAACRRALELSPDDDLVYFNLANALAAQGGKQPEALAEARASYERALELNPRHADAYLNYAALLAGGGDRDGARRLLERARRAGVADPDVELELGVLELSRGQLDPARGAFERALALNPCAEGVHEALGRLADRAGQFAGAAAHYERALDCRPSAGLAKTLGSIYLHRLRDPVRARTAFRRALALSAPDDPDRETLLELLQDLQRGS